MLVNFLFVYFITIIYSIYLFKNKYEASIILILLTSITLKLFLIFIEINNSYINQFTFRDESTFILYTLTNYKNSYLSLSPGDNFLTSILSIVYFITNSEISIKIIPLVFSLICFHYILKICSNLGLYNYELPILILFLFWPSNIFFHYSVTKEFLQLTFMIISTYYFLKVMTNNNLINYLKVFLILLLFSYSHRGFEIVSFVILFYLFLDFLLKKIKLNFFNLLILVLFTLIIFLLVIYFIPRELFIGKLITENFLDWFNNIRISNNYSVNNYELILEDFNFIVFLLFAKFNELFLYLLFF